LKVLGIETSCDECAAAVVENGRVLSNVVATQIPVHAPYQGVVPELASRTHTVWIYGVVKEALDRAGMTSADVEGVAATAFPGLLGSLLVGLHFAKAFAWARQLPFIAVDHLLAHLYAPRLAGANAETAAYPFLGLLVSGGHSVICRVENFDKVSVLGSTIDDAAGEAFDKIAKHYGMGYPGGPAIDALARGGNADTFQFPLPNLYKTGKNGRNHRYDVSYSGLKTAVVNQREQFRVKPRRADRVTETYGADTASKPYTDSKAEISESEKADIAASFQKTAIDILFRAVVRAAEDTGLSTIVAGGGVAANSCLRARAAGYPQLRFIFPPLEYCGDNGAMVAGIGEQYLLSGETSPFELSASPRIKSLKRVYP
jgi:N6-L-threonylcarbamoyladenine synthase